MKILVSLMFFAVSVYALNQDFEQLKACLKAEVGIDLPVTEKDIPIFLWMFVEKCKKHCEMIKKQILVRGQVTPEWAEKLKCEVKGVTGMCEIGSRLHECHGRYTRNSNIKTDDVAKVSVPDINMLWKKFSSLI